MSEVTRSPAGVRSSNRINEAAVPPMTKKKLVVKR